MAQLRRKVTNLSQARFDRVNKLLSFSNSPKLSLDFIQASLVLPVFRNQQKLLQTTMVHPELICTNLQFQPTKSLLETKARCAHRSIYQQQIFITSKEPEAIIWKNLWQSLSTQIRVDYSVKMSATCKSYLPTTRATILSYFITCTAIGNFLENFCKAVMMRMSIQFSMLREISTSQDKLLR